MVGGKGAATQEMSRKTISYATPALEKGLDVIELLAHQREGLTKSQIARELHRTVSEIFRMLETLKRRGYISQVAEDRYALTLKLFKLVQEHPPTERLIADALPILHCLARETLQSCHLGVLEQGQVVILAQVNAPTNVGFYVKLGSTVDLMEAASGYVLLAYQTEVRREQMLADWSRETGEIVPHDLEEHLARIRRQGFERRESYLVQGVVNFSFPILDDRGAAIAALTVPFIQHAIAPVEGDEVIGALQRAAQQLTGAIGGKFTVLPEGPAARGAVPS